MRESLRQRCHAIWVIACTPEGHQPEASSRIFRGVQQPLCIVLAARWRQPLASTDKFAALQTLQLDASDWQDCPDKARAPFLPSVAGGWALHPSLKDLFDDNGSGVKPGRTWMIAPGAESLRRRSTG